MTTRNKSFLILFLIYLTAVTIGIASFIFLKNFELIYRVLIADVLMTLFTWIMSLILKNASIYDPYWSVIPPLIIFGVIIFLNKQFELSLALLLLGFLIWSFRLTYNWVSHWKDFSEVDWRYKRIQEKAPKLYFLTNLLSIQLFPTLIVFVQLVGAIYFIQNEPPMNVLIWIGFIFMVLAAIIQFIADEQMKKFKDRTQGEKLCIEEGLWKYSRHPNYFGEITLWWGVYLMYFGSVMTFDLLIFAPIAMTALFLFVSIPWMEKKILITRPEYVDYQKRVSRIIPFFRNEEHSPSPQENS